MRERVKVVSREAMTQISRHEVEEGAEVSCDLVGHPGELGVPGAVERFGRDYSGPESLRNS